MTEMEQAQPMLVADFLESSARQRPEKVALICDGRRLTYAMIDSMANRMSNAFRDEGVTLVVVTHSQVLASRLGHVTEIRNGRLENRGAA